MPELFKIDNIIERTDIKPDGTFVTTMEVQFTTARGVRSSVQIPKEKFTKELARELVEKAAREIEGTFELSR